MPQLGCMLLLEALVGTYFGDNMCHIALWSLKSGEETQS